MCITATTLHNYSLFLPKGHFAIVTYHAYVKIIISQGLLVIEYYTPKMGGKKVRDP